MVKDWSVVSGGLDNVYSINGLGGIYIAVPITVIGVTATATMDEVNAAIKQYVADNDVYVMFVLDAPTWEPLPSRYPVRFKCPYHLHRPDNHHSDSGWAAGYEAGVCTGYQDGDSRFTGTD